MEKKFEKELPPIPGPNPQDADRALPRSTLTSDVQRWDQGTEVRYRDNKCWTSMSVYSQDTDLTTLHFSLQPGFSSSLSTSPTGAISVDLECLLHDEPQIRHTLDILADFLTCRCPHSLIVNILIRSFQGCNLYQALDSDQCSVYFWHRATMLLVPHCERYGKPGVEAL